MNDVIAETEFDCRDRDGNYFTARLLIGDMRSTVVRDHVTECILQISFEPLFPERGYRGGDSFNAICCAIELVRKALRAFVAHGGAVYFPGGRTPIDIEDYAFCPICEPIAERFLSGPAPDYSRIDAETTSKDDG